MLRFEGLALVLQLTIIIIVDGLLLVLTRHITFIMVIRLNLNVLTLLCLVWLPLQIDVAVVLFVGLLERPEHAAAGGSPVIVGSDPIDVLARGRLLKLLLCFVTLL